MALEEQFFIVLNNHRKWYFTLKTGSQNMEYVLFCKTNHVVQLVCCSIWSHCLAARGIVFAVACQDLESANKKKELTLF